MKEMKQFDLQSINGSIDKSKMKRPKSSRAEIVQAFASVFAAFISLFAAFISLLAISSVAISLARDDKTSLMIDGEQAFISGNYELSYQKFSSALLYDNAIAKAYLGYLNSNGLGCEKNVLLGTEQYRKALSLGYDGCENNLLFNVVNYSTCYYEIADALLEAYEHGNVCATLFLADSICHRDSSSVSDFRGETEFLSGFDLKGAKNEVDSRLTQSGKDVQEVIIEALQAAIDHDLSEPKEIKLNYPSCPWSTPCNHDTCSVDADLPLYYCSNYECYTDPDGNILWYITVFRYTFKCGDFIPQIVPTIIP